MRQTLVLAAIAAAALLGASCSPSSGPIYPMTIGSVWNMSMYTRAGDTLATLDTMSTGTQTNTALAKVNLANGKEVTKFRNDATVHFKAQDSTVTTTSYSYVAEVGDTIFSYANLDDTTGTPMMRSTPEVGQTWTEGSSTATVVGQEDVTVAGGTYKGAWKVKLSSSNGGVTMDIYEWFAKGTGMVKVHYDYTNSGLRTVYNAELTSANVK